MEPGQLCTVVATFIEDRNGRALIRLPNGSKTSIHYGALSASSARGHFVPAQDNSSVAVYCLHGDWSATAVDYNDAAEQLRGHTAGAHEPT